VRSGKSISESPVPAGGLRGLLDLIADGTISGRIAKEVFEIMFETGKPASAIVEEKGMRQVSDEGAIMKVVIEVTAANPGQVEEYQKGNMKVLGWFVGQVMRATGGKANPGLVNDLLKKKLS